MCVSSDAVAGTTGPALGEDRREARGGPSREGGGEAAAPAGVVSSDMIRALVVRGRKALEGPPLLLRHPSQRRPEPGRWMTEVLHTLATDATMHPHQNDGGHWSVYRG